MIVVCICVAMIVHDNEDNVVDLNRCLEERYVGWDILGVNDVDWNFCEFSHEDVVATESVIGAVIVEVVLTDSDGRGRCG